MSVVNYSIIQEEVNVAEFDGEPVGCQILPAETGNSTGLDLIPTKFRFVDGKTTEKTFYMRNLVTGGWVKVDPVRSRVYKLRRKIFAWADVMKLQEDKMGVSYVFQGMTYRPGEAYSPHDITEYICGVKKAVGNDGILGYAWVGEMQVRGVPQYHVLWAIRPDVYLPYPDKSGLWSHGSSSVSKRGNLKVRSYYICKYLSKLETKIGFPKGFRIFGVYVRKGLLGEYSEWRLRMTNYPRWLVQKMIDDNLMSVTPKRVKGGGWLIDEKYGVVLYSDWVREAIPGLVDCVGEAHAAPVVHVESVKVTSEQETQRVRWFRGFCERMGIKEKTTQSGAE